MQNPIEKALARIRTGDGRTAGAGWLIAPTRLITCAHVVNAAIGRDLACPDRPPEGTRISLDLSNREPKVEGALADVLHWVPPDSDARPADIAILALDAPILPLERPTTLAPKLTPASGENGHGYGFPKRAGDGLVATARISGSPDGLLQVDSLGKPEIEPGFSGGPFTDARGRVIGMTVQRNTSHAVARIIPVDLLERAWYELAALREQGATPSITIHLRGRSPLLIETPHGRRQLDVEQLPAGDPVALHRALFADTAERDAMLHPRSGDGDSRRLTLVTGTAAGAAHPWHSLASAPGQPLGGEGWIIETARDPRPAGAPRALQQVLILAPGHQELAPGAVRHVNRMTAQLRRLMVNPDATPDRAHDQADLTTSLRRDPDLVYCYARLDREARLMLGQDPASRETLSPEELIHQLSELKPPPLLWLHCIEDSKARLDAPPLFDLTGDFPLVCVQRTTKRKSADSRDQAYRWVDRLASGSAPMEPAAALSALPDPGALCWQARAGLALAPPDNADAALRAEIHAALIRLRLGRDTHKTLINRAVERAKDRDLRLYAVGGEPDACPHELPDQARYDLETREIPYRVELHWLPLPLTPDQDLEEDLADALEQHLGIGSLATREALERRMVPPLPNERVVICLAWLAKLDPELSSDELTEALGTWRQFLLETFTAANIPVRCRMVSAACIEWPADWPERQDTDVQALRDLLEEGVDGPLPEHADWVPDLPALDLLDQNDLTRFFREFAKRPDSPVQGLAPRKLARWCLTECQGRFEDTVTLIYQGCRDRSFPHD